MVRFKAIFLRIAAAFAILLTFALAANTVDASIGIIPVATNASSTGSLTPIVLISGDVGSIDTSGSWMITGTVPGLVTTFYDFVPSNSASLTSGQTYQITNNLDMRILGIATSGSYTATTYLDSTASSASRVSGALATQSGTFNAGNWTGPGGSLVIAPSTPASTNFLLTGASGPYYFEQYMTISLTGVNPGQSYTFQLTTAGSDDSGIAPAPTQAVPEPTSLVVWAGLGLAVGTGACKRTSRLLHARKNNNNSRRLG